MLNNQPYEQLPLAFPVDHMRDPAKPRFQVAPGGQDEHGSYRDHRIMAFKGGAQVGHIDWSSHPQERSIDMVRVHPEYREQGIGSRLVEEAMGRGANFKRSVAITHEGEALMEKFDGFRGNQWRNPYG